MIVSINKGIVMNSFYNDTGKRKQKLLDKYFIVDGSNEVIWVK